MNELLFSLNAVFPLLLIMTVGFLARRTKLVGEQGARDMDSCVYYIFLPLMLLFSFLDTGYGHAFDGKTMAFAFLATVAGFLFMFWLAPRLCPQRNARGVLVQATIRSNYAFFGIPLVLSIYPNADTGIAAMMIIVVVPVFNLCATIALMLYGDEKMNLGKLLRGIVLNPLIIAMAIGMGMWALRLSLPPLLETPLRMMNRVASPLALFTLGASLDFGKARANRRLLTIGVVGKLIIAPAIFLPIAIALGIRGVPLATLVAVFASPTAVSSYPMARKMGGDAELAAAQIALSTAGSVVTVFLIVLLLKTVGCL